MLFGVALILTSKCGPDDFEFINMSGEQATVPFCRDKFRWNGRAVKELAGSGAVYIRLTKEFGTSLIPSDYSSDLLSLMSQTRFMLFLTHLLALTLVYAAETPPSSIVALNHHLTFHLI